MTKISTLFYIVDNTNSEENIDIAGKILDEEFKDIIDLFKADLFEPSEEIVNKVISSSRYF